MCNLQSGVYKITNLVNNKIYIGSSCKLKNRKREHFYGLKSNKHGNPRLQNSYNKYGEDNFSFEIIETCDLDSLLIREQYYIDILDPFFNICKVAGSTLGVRPSEESKAKLRASLRAINHAPSDEARRKALEVTKGRKLPKESLEKRLETMSNWSEEQKAEHRQKLSEGAKNRSRESLDKIAKGRWKAVIQLDLSGNFIREWGSAQHVQESLNISKAAIGSCCKKKVGYKSAGGFKWSYKD